MSILNNSPKIDDTGKIVYKKSTWDEELSVYPHPIEPSHEVDVIEAELKKLFLEIMGDIAVKLHDANSFGVPYRASEEYVRRAMINDGLILIENIQDPSKLRKLYSSWVNQTGRQKRGLTFLQDYMNILYGDGVTVNQLWLDKDRTYPTEIGAVREINTWWKYQLNETGRLIDGTWKFNGQDTSQTREEDRTEQSVNAFLSSRVKVALSFDSGAETFSRLRQVFSMIAPARFVPEFVLWAPETFGEGATIDVRITVRIEDESVPEGGPTRKLHVSSPHEFLVKNDSPEILNGERVSATISTI